MTGHGLGVLSAAEWPAGTRRVRLWDLAVTWRDLHTAPGVFDWSALEHVLDVAQAHGTTSLLMVLGTTPRWAARNPDTTDAAPWLGPGSNSPPADLATWDEYVRAIVRRYANRIRYWQIWNEPQLRDFWATNDYRVLGEMTRRAYLIIKAIDPGLKVVSAPVLPRPSSGGMVRGRQVLQVLAAHKWPCDVLAAHIYPEPGYGPPRWRALARSWKRTLADMRAPKRPLWITETNWNLMAGPLPAKVIPEYIAKTATIAEHEGIARIYYYAFGRHSDPRVLGIPFTPGSPGMTALRPFLEA